jgi:hypothetical protein
LDESALIDIEHLKIISGVFISGDGDPLGRKVYPGITALFKEIREPAAPAS